MRTMLTVSSVALLIATFAACKSDKQPTERATPEAPVKTEELAEAAAPTPPKSSSVPGTPNQLMVDQRIPDVKLEMTSPKNGETLESGQAVEVRFDLQNYRTGNEIGQHIHIILDNEPYEAHYNASEPWVFENVPDGTHTIRAFPARHYHLALKEGDVFEVATFHVGAPSEDFSFDASKPYVTYSRPKGSYDAESAKNLLLDFYVQNVTLGTDAKVIYAVNGEETELTEWKPILLDPLEPGEHAITLKLVDMNGTLIENGGYNNTTRTVTVK